jgi:hypothetical protein
MHDDQFRYKNNQYYYGLLVIECTLTSLFTLILLLVVLLPFIKHLLHQLIIYLLSFIIIITF